MTVTLRTDLRPGDLGAIVSLHGTLYASEQAFDVTFEAYVAEALGAHAQAASPRGRIWLAEIEGRLAGCIAITPFTETDAQLRWYLIDPSARGTGLGKRLMAEALAFCRSSGYARVFLWTVAALATAAHVYRSAGFELVEVKPGHAWGVDVVEQRYELTLQ